MLSAQSSNFSLHQNIGHRPTVQSCLLKILQPEYRQTFPEVARNCLIADGFRITRHLSNTGIVSCVVHKDWVVCQGWLRCSWVQKHRGLINGSFSRSNCCRNWKCVGGNLHGDGDKSLRFKVPRINTKLISSAEH